MFEKSLYDLIRGLRNHKSSENDYIQHSLRECRAEIKGSDMDFKATALLKLIYLEMFGHDMSWASFHVLEVMSSAKFAQKRVGYLAAAQSFRPDTEVLMLATNLLKKDIASPLPQNVSLPLLTVPHVITPSLAHSLIPDILPRLSHSNPSVRKKSVAALHRLALVYPDSLKSAWAKMKGMLLDNQQDSSVVAAIVNVVCELGWRRPRDFLPLAPKLFELLVEGGNNWMAIKIIKLFASLTPLEPRLIKKLLVPLTNLIRSTPAMSLLCECINGVIQGGILEGVEVDQEGDEIASLCVTKLRSMIVVDGDPNLKFVALLAFTRIVGSHAHLVSVHEDVIMNCINDPDVSIRLKALDLVSGMTTSENLVTIVEALMRQLEDGSSLIRGLQVEPLEEDRQSDYVLADERRYLPKVYRLTVIRYILDICSRDTYANMTDFEWYIEILLRLFNLAPRKPLSNRPYPLVTDVVDTPSPDSDVNSVIGWQLRNVAVRVEAIRSQVVEAAETLLKLYEDCQSSHHGQCNADVTRAYAAWVAGEYVLNSNDVQGLLTSLLRADIVYLAPSVICSYVQALFKVFAYIIRAASSDRQAESQTLASLRTVNVISFLRPLTFHPNLEVQERAVGFFGLLQLVQQAIEEEGQKDDGGSLLLIEKLPQIFTGSSLKSVAPSAQGKVPTPTILDLEKYINPRLLELLDLRGDIHPHSFATARFRTLYYDRSGPISDINVTESVSFVEGQSSSPAGLIQTTDEVRGLTQQGRKRSQRNIDDPFYIAQNDGLSIPHTPTERVFQTPSEEGFDVESIPIMSLDLSNQPAVLDTSDIGVGKKRKPRKVRVDADITIDDGEPSLGHKKSATKGTMDTAQMKRSLLSINSSEISKLALSGDTMTENAAMPDPVLQDLEMARALAEVERLRLEMQRASERVQATDGTPAEGTLVTTKKRKESKKSTPLDGPDLQEEVAVAPKKRKKKIRKRTESEDAPRVTAALANT